MPRLSGPAPAAPPVARAVQIVAGLQAALLLGRGEVRGVAFANLSPAAAARSFWAAVICLPGFALLRVADLDAVTDVRLAAELIGYVLGWVVFPLVVLPLVEASGRGPLWPVFVAAWNWANVAQYAVLLVAALLERLLPATLASTVHLASFGYAVWIEWFVARAALRVTGARAAVLTALDLIIGLTIAVTAARIGG